MANLAPPVPRNRPSRATTARASAPSRAATENAATSVEERSRALAFLSNLAAEVSKGAVNLPSFPEVVMRIRRVLAEPNVRLSEIVRIVGTEPRLAARLLQVANSAAFNPSGKHLTDLPGAITRLGHRQVQGAVMAFAVKQLRLAPALRSISKSLNALWEQSISVAAICQVVARRTKLSPDEAFLTGLLHGIGRLYITVRVVGAAEKVHQDGDLRDMISGWHPAIGKAVLQNWGFEESMCEAVGDQMDHERGVRGEPDLTDVLVVSVALAMFLEKKLAPLTEVTKINSFARLHMNSNDCADVLRHTEYQIGSLHAALGC